MVVQLRLNLLVNLLELSQELPNHWNKRFEGALQSTHYHTLSQGTCISSLQTSGICVSLQVLQHQ